MRVVTFKIDERLLERLDMYAVNNKLSRSDVIREAIEFYLNVKEQEKLALTIKTVLGEL